MHLTPTTCIRYAKRKTPTKTLLMNHKVVVGIGNICKRFSWLKYTRASQHMPLQAEAKAIVQHSRACLQAQSCGGTTLKDFQKADGAPEQSYMFMGAKKTVLNLPNTD